jgi:hypothetical protein
LLLEVLGHWSRRLALTSNASFCARASRFTTYSSAASTSTTPLSLFDEGRRRLLGHELRVGEEPECQRLEAGLALDLRPVRRFGLYGR